MKLSTEVLEDTILTNQLTIHNYQYSVNELQWISLKTNTC